MTLALGCCGSLLLLPTLLRWTRVAQSSSSLVVFLCLLLLLLLLVVEEEAGGSRRPHIEAVMGMQESNVRPTDTPNTLFKTGAFIIEMILFHSDKHVLSHLNLPLYKYAKQSKSMQTLGLQTRPSRCRCSLTRLMLAHALIREDKVLIKRSFVCTAL